MRHRSAAAAAALFVSRALSADDWITGTAGHSDRDGLDCEHGVGDVRREIGLRQHHDGLSAALPHGSEITFEAPRIEICVERHHQKNGIDI